MATFPPQNYLTEIMNSTNFTSLVNIEQMFSNIFVNIYKSAYQESKLYFSVLITVLLVSCLIGSLANLFVIFIFKNLFQIKFNIMWMQNQNGEIYSLNSSDKAKIKKTTTNQSESERYFKNLVNHLDSNSKLKSFYKLLFHLTVVDLFTCSIVIPITVYEISNNMIISEFNCKLFEFIRGIGVISSNFLVIFIAVERFMALYNKNQFKYFNFRILIVLIVTILISTIFMFQVSVYQKPENVTIFIGVCLKSNYLINRDITRIINIFVTLLFLFGSIIVSAIYVIIFIKVFEINNKKKKEEYMKNERSNATNVQLINFKNTNEDSIESTSEYNYFCYYLRLAITILLLTIIYYVSIIPWCLTINQIINYDPYFHNLFLLNKFLDPFIYLFLNPHFRNFGLHLLKSKLNCKLR